MTWIVVTLIVAGVAARALLDGQKAPVHVWQQLASGRGGVYVEGAVRPVVEVDVRDARVRLELDERAPRRPESMTCRARYLVPLGPVFRVQAGGPPSSPLQPAIASGSAKVRSQEKRCTDMDHMGARQDIRTRGRRPRRAPVLARPGPSWRTYCSPARITTTLTEGSVVGPKPSRYVPTPSS